MEQFEKYLKRKEKNRQAKKDRRKDLKDKYEWFTNDLLIEHLKIITNGYIWYKEKYLEGLGGKQRVDVVAESTIGDRHVYLEIERGQSRPISNVAKIWRHIAEGKLNEPILLIQIFSPYYAKSEGSHNTRMEESIFVGLQAEKTTTNIIYKYFRPDDWPPSADKMDSVIQKISALLQGGESI
jgi:hypothetical protein